MAEWWQFTIATECDDNEADTLESVLRLSMTHWGHEYGIDIHVESEKVKPRWLAKARNCDIPDCPFPAEWIVEVSINGTLTEYAGCGAHRQDLAASAALASDVAWGEAAIAVKQI